MKKAIFTMILCAAACFLHAQEVTNINAVQQGNTIVIFYDLDKDSDIMISASLNGGKNFIDLTEVTGDVGKDIIAGKEKKIYWNAVEEIGFANVEKMQFQVKAVSNVIVANKEELVYNKGNLCLMRKIPKINESGRTYNEVEFEELSKAEVLSIMMENGKENVYYDYYLKGENRKKVGKIIGGTIAGIGISLFIILGSSDYGTVDYYDNVGYYASIGGTVVLAGGTIWAITVPSGNKKIKKAAQLYNDGPSKKSYGMSISPAKSGIGVCLNF